MIFFELLDIAMMLETTHDPIGDFVNAATSDVVDFTGRYDFESFKHNSASEACSWTCEFAVEIPEEANSLSRIIK